jgi:Protein of unknown function (DUF2934)
MGREDEIRLVAYRIWEEEGCPNGRDCEHWYRAEAIWGQEQNPEMTSPQSSTELSADVSADNSAESKPAPKRKSKAASAKKKSNKA